MPRVPTSGPGSDKAKSVASKFKASGPGRPAPIKKQPLPAYGPYELPLSNTEKRIVINKRTPKYVETPRGRIATGGGGVGFFTKGDMTPIMARVAQRALARQSDIEESSATRLSSRRSVPEPVEQIAKRPDESGLKGFYDEHVLPVVGRAFADFYDTTKDTYGTNVLLAPIVGPVVYGAKAVDTVAEKVGINTNAEKKVNDSFDTYVQSVVGGAYGIAKTKGWDNAKPYVVPAIDKASEIVKASKSATQNAVTDSADWTDKKLVGNVVYDWSKKNAAVPARDFVADTYEYLFNPGFTERVDSLSQRDRDVLYRSNDMENRNPDAVSSVYSADERERLIRLASGQANDNSLWANYNSGFTVEELSKMSDYELINAATGAHSNQMQRTWNAAQNDFKKIGAMAAGVQQLGKVIEESQKNGDYRGLGYMAEYLATQAGYNVWALHQAGAYAGTGGLSGDYKPLVRALQTEPILTTLDAAATATLYGKAATVALKTGGGLSRVGAAASRVPGAARAGSRIATAAERAAYRMEGAASGIGPEARVPTTLGGPLRAAAAVGRGARRIADTEVVVANNPVFTRLRENTEGVDPTSGQGTVYLPGTSFFSKGRAILRKKIYEQDNAVGQVVRDISRKADAAKERALISHVANVMGSQRAQVYVRAFQRLVKQDPVVAQRALFDLQGLDMLDLPESLVSALGTAGGGGKLIIGPAEELARLQRVLDGELWVRRGVGDNPDEFRYTTEDISDTGFQQVLTVAEAEKRGFTDESLYVRLSPDETSNLEGNMAILVRIAEADPEKVRQAKEFLSVAIEGARRGRGEPASSIEDLAAADELSNIEALATLGKTGDRRVEDLPGNLGDDLGIPEAAGASRRQRAAPETADAEATEDLSLLARVQDPTVARLLAAPIAGVLRDKIVAILSGARVRTEAKAGRLADVSANARRAAEDAAAELRVAENALDELEGELAKVSAVELETIPGAVENMQAGLWSRISSAVRQRYSEKRPGWVSVEYVRARDLRNMEGNATDAEKVSSLRGQEYDNPIILDYDPDTGFAYISEGNNRLAAAVDDQWVPVQVMRGRVSLENQPTAQRITDPGVLVDSNNNVPQYLYPHEVGLSVRGVKAKATRGTSVRKSQADAAKKTKIRSLNSKIASRKKKILILRAKSERLGTVDENVATRADAARAEADTIAEAQGKIDAYVESALRDLIEAGDIPGGGRVFFPTERTPEGAKMDYDPTKALAGRGGKRDLLDVHTAQIALVGSAEQISKFGSALAQNLRLPMVALQIVTRLNAYLMRTGVVIEMAKTRAGFAKQLASIIELQRLYGGTADDFRIIVIDEKTGFLGERLLKDLEGESLDKVASTGVEGIEIGEARIGQIIDEAIRTNALDAFDFDTMNGKRIVIVETSRLNKLNQEIARAAQGPSLLEKLSRKWVRVTLNTLPRTAFTNIVGSAVLAGLGGTGLRGFIDAYRLMKSGDIPAEISRVGMAGIVDTPFAARLGEGGLWASTVQRYMDALQTGNVVGEDFARMAVFIGSVRKSLKNNPALVAQLEKELAEAGKVNAAFEDLLAFVARGEYGKGKLASPEAIAVRDKAIASATDFLGSQAGLTSKTRRITQFIPFYHWYAHIIKLYFWTMPLNYPGRTIFLNTLARISEDQQRESGLMDSFYSDAVRVGTQMAGENEYAVGLRTGLLPFSGFGGIGAGESSAPLVDYIFASTTPLITAPAVVSGITGDFRPMLSASGERIPNLLAPGGIEAAMAQLERTIAPLGFLQRTFSPSGSLFASAAQGFPEVEQRRPGDDYALTPRGFPGLGARGLAESALGGLTGLSIIRTPVAGPVKRRQIKGREKSQLQEFKDAKKKEREANKK